MFTLYCIQGMSFSPNKEDLEAGMEGVVARLEEALLCIKVRVLHILMTKVLLK